MTMIHLKKKNTVNGIWLAEKADRQFIDYFSLFSIKSVSKPHAGIIWSCTPPRKSFYLFPLKKKMLRLLQFADTLNTNTTMPLLLCPHHVDTHPSFFPTSNTKLPVVAMATAGVHESSGTLHFFKLSSGLFQGAKGLVTRRGVGGRGAIHGTDEGFG